MYLAIGLIAAMWIWLMYELKTAPVESLFYKAFDIPKTAECPKCNLTSEILHPVHTFYYDEAHLVCPCGYKAKGQGENPLEAVEDLKAVINRDKEKELA